MKLKVNYFKSKKKILFYNIDILSYINKSFDDSNVSNIINSKIKSDDKSINFKDIKISLRTPVTLIAFGKASSEMMNSFYDIIDEKKIKTALLISHDTKRRKLFKNKKKIKYLSSTHPKISKQSILAGKEIIKFVKNTSKNDTLIFLVSGGGSSMVASPINGITGSQKIKFINKLILSGIPERETTIIKKNISNLKAGKLLTFANTSKIYNFILSDERNHSIKAISSGTTVGQKIPKIDDFLKKFDFNDSFMKKIIANTKTIKHKNKIIKTKNIIIGSRLDFVKKLKENSLKNKKIKSFKYISNIHSKNVDESTDYFYKKISNIFKISSKGIHIVIFTGEIPVKVDNENAKGGRNQHLVTNMIKKFKNNIKFNFTFLAIGTDGMDYLKGIAGGFFNNSILKKISINNIDKYLDKQNTYFFLKNNDLLINSDITSQNISDFYIFLFKK